MSQVTTDVSTYGLETIPFPGDLNLLRLPAAADLIATWFSGGTDQSSACTSVPPVCRTFPARSGGIIAAFWTSLAPNKVIPGINTARAVQTRVSGTVPYRLFTVQWHQIAYSSGTTNPLLNPPISIELRLWETYDAIEVVFGPLRTTPFANGWAPFTGGVAGVPMPVITGLLTPTAGRAV